MDMINFLGNEPLSLQWAHAFGLFLAFILSSLIGFERELRYKSAGLRTHALVGLAGALLMLVSKYGFGDVITLDHVGLDPSRVAAQVVSGIGFIGGGLIFVRKDIVHGLTTAATVWLTVSVGMACGAGMYIMAILTCAAYFIVAFGYTRLMTLLRGTSSRLVIHYKIGQDAASNVLALCAAREFTMLGFEMGEPQSDPETATVEVRVLGKTSVADLATDIAKLPAILSVSSNPSEKD